MIENTSTPESANSERPMRVAAGAIDLEGLLNTPEEAHGLVLLAHGIDSDGNASPFPAIAQAFNQRRLATLQVEMFTPDEQELDRRTGYFANNIDIMQQRFIHMADWLLQHTETENFSIGYFGTGSCGAAALVAAAERPDNVRTVVAAGGAVALAREHLGDILAPVLLIAAGNDNSSVQANQDALAALKGQKEFETVAGASALFADSRGIDEMIRLAGEWFSRWLVTIV